MSIETSLNLCDLNKIKVFNKGTNEKNNLMICCFCRTHVCFSSFDVANLKMFWILIHLLKLYP